MSDLPRPWQVIPRPLAVCPLESSIEAPEQHGDNDSEEISSFRGEALHRHREGDGRPNVDVPLRVEFLGKPELLVREDQDETNVDERLVENQGEDRPILQGGVVLLLKPRRVNEDFLRYQVDYHHDQL